MNHLGTPRVAKHAGLLHVRISCALALLTFTLTACGGGGGAGSVVATTTQQVTGTLGIGTAQAVTLGNRLRKPAYVSGSTTNARLFINGGASAANSSTTCTPASGTAGTGTACTITWSTSLAVPASYTFAVEVDDGTTVLAEGSATEAIVAGNNTLSTLTLNGVVAKASFVTLSCVAGTAGVTPGTCNGAVILEDADSNTIEYNGPSTTVVAGNNPTTGTVFDNAPPATPVTLAASNGNGLVIGTAESYGAGPYVLSTFAANTLSISGVTGSSATPANAYTYEVQCKTASTTGTFGITVGGGTTPSGDVTAGELGALTYPASITTVATAPSYTCTNGVISSATGTLPIN